MNLPEHLKKYIVEQDYSKYTPIDQAVWRYCLRQLKSFLSIHGHPVYVKGLEKTGISIDTIPSISEISIALEKFGWVAMPVSGFIPPAAFMELQSLGILPIASDIRTIDHLLYTPAPDIVHEAAGHAPIIIDEEYASYLKQYSQVAKKSIISKEDLDLYEAIRDLSDIKENRSSTSTDIAWSEKRLEQTIKNVTHVSEAAQLSRMNWWTAEYGLIGDLENPRIFGAGLLSSLGESRWCLSAAVKKIPLTIDCVKQSYDITEPQPQLFVTPDFKTLVRVLDEFSKTMAYRIGGPAALDKLVLAKSVNTVELDTGFQVSGILENYLQKNDEIIFLKFSGSSQISAKDHQLTGHGPDYHQHGYSTPLGKFQASSFTLNTSVHFKYESGFEIQGILKKIDQGIYTFAQATMTFEGKVFFQPEWGDLDIITGQHVISAYGGPADRECFGATDDFVAAKVPPPQYNERQIKTFNLYQKIREARLLKRTSREETANLLKACLDQAPKEWLIFVELLEISTQNSYSELILQIKNHLYLIIQEQPQLKSVIEDGIKLAHA